VFNRYAREAAGYLIVASPYVLWDLMIHRPRRERTVDLVALTTSESRIVRENVYDVAGRIEEEVKFAQAGGEATTGVLADR
jgi:hypothetical protein